MKHRKLWIPPEFRERGALIGIGKSRLVYSLGLHFVLKVPRNEYGLSDNDLEAYKSRRWGRGPDINGIHYAKCRILPYGWLVMEYVDTRFIREPKRPDWADFVDCWQVGRARDGRIVAYDFGY